MASEPSPIVVAPEGEIDLHSSPLIKEQIEPLIDGHRASIIVDLSGVTYIDSSGLAVFIEAMQRIHAYGGKFSLCGLGENVRHIFSIARLDQVFPIFPDQKGALEAG